MPAHARRRRSGGLVTVSAIPPHSVLGRGVLRFDTVPFRQAHRSQMTLQGTQARGGLHVDARRRLVATPRGLEEPEVEDAKWHHQRGLSGAQKLWC